MSPSTPPRLLRVRGWDRVHENSRSREIFRLQWVPVLNDFSADSYVLLVTRDDGAAYLGVWTALLMVASRARPRGQLVRENGRPHTAETLSIITRLPEELVNSAIDCLLEIGLLEILKHKSHIKRGLSSHRGAAKPQDPADGSDSDAAQSQDGAHRTEGNHHHQEEKRKKREQERNGPKRTKPEGTEGARGDSTTKGSDPPREAGFSFSKKSDDSKERCESHYASPEDELKAIYFSKTGEHITIALLNAIRDNLELTCVSMSDFVVEVREHHFKNEWRNPAGFLRDLSKRFVAKTRQASRPKTASEVAAENYQCKMCASRTPGEGALPGSDGKFVPCTCASEEYITRQRARGVFAEEAAP